MDIPVGWGIQIEQSPRFENPHHFQETDPKHFRMLKTGTREHDVCAFVWQWDLVGVCQYDIYALACGEIHPGVLKLCRCDAAQTSVHIERSDFHNPGASLGFEANSVSIEEFLAVLNGSSMHRDS